MREKRKTRGHGQNYKKNKNEHAETMERRGITEGRHVGKVDTTKQLKNGQFKFK